MDPFTLVAVTIGYAASVVAKAVADKLVQGAYTRLITRIQDRLGRYPSPSDLSRVSLREIRADQDDEILHDANQILGGSSALRRALKNMSVLRGARVLWVDDSPDFIVHEREMLQSLGVIVDVAASTDEALSILSENSFDLVISDIKRAGRPNEGLNFVEASRSRHLDRPTVFYIAKLEREKGTPPYAFGITNHPEELLHFVLDILERERI